MTRRNSPFGAGNIACLVILAVLALAYWPLGPADAADKTSSEKQTPDKRQLTAPAKTQPVKTLPTTQSTTPPAANVRRKKPRGPVRLGTPPRTQRKSGIAAVGGNVQISTLAGVDAASIGSISPNDAGFPADMWRGVSRQKLINLIPHLPAGGASPIVRQLFRRLLLTRAVAPKGTARDGITLLAAKVRKLAEAGHLADVEAIVRQLPPALAGEDLLDARLDALLLSGDTATACKLAASQVQETPNARWNKKIAFCHALRGEIDRAELLEGRLRETGPQRQKFF